MGASFHTLEREKYFRNPPTDKAFYPLLEEAIEPHVESFNALVDGPDGGLLNLAIKDIGTKAVFDTNSTESLGNKLSYRIENVQITKPAARDKDVTTINRKQCPLNAENAFPHTEAVLFYD